jgi:NADH/F420H2 dehydrogenase subunit C
VLEETGQWPVLLSEPAAWTETATQLRNNNDLYFDFLFCLTCIDWKTHFTMVYHLRSTVHQHTLVVKIKTDHHEPEVESVARLWRTAEFHEREVYDLFGVRFLNHPDLRRLLLTDDWVGYPLRKDYEDEINMIKL